MLNFLKNRLLCREQEIHMKSLFAREKISAFYEGMEDLKNEYF